MFTVKAITTYRMTQETAQGVVRMHETKHQSMGSVLIGYFEVLLKLLRTPQTLYTAGIMLVLSISAYISGTFWAVLVTEKLHVADQNLWYFLLIRSVVMIVFFFVVMPWISKLPFKLPLAFGFLLYLLSQALLITTPDQGYAMLFTSVFLEACSYATVAPLVDRLIVLTVDAKERARIQSILYVWIILLTAPFPWIAGWLASIDNNLPFILMMALFAIGALLAYLAGRAAERALAAEALPAEGTA
jgi:Na+/melibiose symporter-like transporter